MTHKFFPRISLAAVMCALVSISVFGNSQAEQDRQARQITVYPREIFDAKVSLIPFDGLKADYQNPIAEIFSVKNNEAAVVKVPAQYLPGEFLLRIDYRAKEQDRPYPAERIIYINEQDIELSADPLHINNDEKIKFNEGEQENTVYGAFMKENTKKRMPIDLLRQLLLNYDQPKSKFYASAVKEFEQRRQEYNKWLNSQAREHKNLYVGRLFQFQHIPKTIWSGNGEDRLRHLLENYFDGIDFKDPLIIRSRELPRFMGVYMELYGMQAVMPELRDSLFTQAGRIACEKASKGHPEVYGWMVDYFYVGYEVHDIKEGMAMLKEHIDNPNCLTSKKQQIISRLEGMRNLVPGALSPDFSILDSQGNNFEFHKHIPRQQYKLLLFSSSTCEACQHISDMLEKWYAKPENSQRVDIIIISIDPIRKEKLEQAGSLGWKCLYLKEGVNSSTARDYSVLSVPAMFLINSKSNIIASVPGGFDELVEGIDSSAAYAPSE